MVFRQPFIVNTQFDNFTIRIFTLHVGDVAEKKTVPFSYTRISVILLVCHVILLQFTNPPLYARAPTNASTHALTRVVLIASIFLLCNQLFWRELITKILRLYYLIVTDFLLSLATKYSQ